MKEILVLLKSARAKIDAANADIGAVRDEDLQLVGDIAAQISELRELLEKSRKEINSKQSAYFHLLAACVSAIEGIPMGTYPGRKFTCCAHEICHSDHGTTTIHIDGGAYDPDRVGVPLFFMLCETMIEKIKSFPHSQCTNQQDLEERVEIVRKLKTKIAELCKDKEIQETLSAK